MTERIKVTQRISDIDLEGRKLKDVIEFLQELYWSYGGDCFMMTYTDLDDTERLGLYITRDETDVEYNTRVFYEKQNEDQERKLYEKLKQKYG